MTRTTRAQRKSIAKLLARMENPIGYREFRRTVSPTIGCDGAVVVHWCNMWIAIERDGYCHS